MQTPPPVSGEVYPTVTGSESRSNVLRVVTNFETSYDDNVIDVDSSIPVADVSYSINPRIALDQTTPRMHRAFEYSPFFTVYQHTSARNEADQDAYATFQYRFSPHAAVNLRETFQKITNVFNQSYEGVPGSTESPTEGVIAPFADQISNLASGELSYQFSPNGMIGGGGQSTVVNYPNPAEAAGLSNSNSYAASAFYNRRLSNAQYMGVNFQYLSMTANATIGRSETKVNTLYGFYTLYLGHFFSLSVSGGPQHFSLVQATFPESSAWTPAITGSMGWQKSHANLAASYSRTVTGAGGLLGAFESNSANASARWQMARTWTLGGTGVYSNSKSVTPLSLYGNQGGHTISGSTSLEHPISERFSAEIGYSRLHQRYSNIAVISQYPDSDREFVSISFQLTKPLGK